MSVEIEQFGVANGSITKRCRTAGREREHHRLLSIIMWSGSFRRSRLGRGLLKHHMCVGSSYAECTDACQALISRPRRRLARDLVRGTRPVDGRIELDAVQACGNPPVMQRQRSLYQTCHTGRALGVPDIGFDRPHQGFAAGSTAFAQDRAQRSEFDRIASARAGSVSLDVSDLGRRASSGSVRAA